MVHSREIIQRSAFPNLELHFTEWSSSYTPTDPFTTSTTKRLLSSTRSRARRKSVNSMAYWVFTDIFESTVPVLLPSMAGFGLPELSGDPQAGFLCVPVSEPVGKPGIAVQRCGFVGDKKPRRRCGSAVLDFTPIVPPAGINDQVFYKKELPAKDKGAVRLEIAQLPAGRYLVQAYRTGYRMKRSLHRLPRHGCALATHEGAKRTRSVRRRTAPRPFGPS